MFSPLSYCRYDGNTNFDGSEYRIGNPVYPKPDDFGFTGWERDQGRSLDGIIKSDTCECDTSHFLSWLSEPEKDLQRYRVYKAEDFEIE